MQYHKIKKYHIKAIQIAKKYSQGDRSFIISRQSMCYTIYSAACRLHAVSVLKCGLAIDQSIRIPILMTTHVNLA